MDDRDERPAVTKSFQSEQHGVTEREFCNQKGRGAVISGSVDTLWSAWVMISTLGRWCQLRSAMMMKRPVNWYDIFIRSWRNWCAHIVHAAPRKKIFAK